MSEHLTVCYCTENLQIKIAFNMFSYNKEYNTVCHLSKVGIADCYRKE